MRFLIIRLAVIILASSSSYAFNLQCNKTYEVTRLFGRKYSCRVFNTNVTFPNEQITSVNGKTEADNASVISFHSQVVKFLPKGIEEFFPNLNVLIVHGSQVESIQQEDLKPFTHLKELDLINNNIDHLDDELFHFNPELRSINFNGNEKLQFVGENILMPLRKLEQVHFDNSNCINMHANGRLEIDQLIAELIRKCPSPTVIKQKFCHEEVNPLKKRILELERQLAAEKAEKMLILERTMAAQKSCNGNLNTVTKNLLVTTKQLKSCSALKVDLICVIDSKGSCNAAHFKVKTRGSVIHEVKDSTETLIKTDRTDKLCIVNQQTLFLPTNIVEFFPALTGLYVIDSGLFEINFNVFENMTNLKNLTLTKNKLLEIPADTFDALRSLEHLDLSMNNIESLESGVFKNLVKVEVLNLSGNRLTVIDFDVLENLTNLRKLKLHNNKLKVIETKLSSPLTQLESVDFSNNLCVNISYPSTSLKVVEAIILNNCVAPIELNCNISNVNTEDTCRAFDLVIEISKTEIYKVNGVSSKHNISVFKVIDQSMKFIPYQLAQMLPNLQKIVIERSNLTSIQKHDFRGFSKLIKLEIRHNNLSSIQEEAFDGAAAIEHLDLSGNKLTSLPSKTFFKLKHLKTLILSNNEIEKITADILPRNNIIESFCANDNRLEVIETKILIVLKKAKLIDFTGNVCIDLKFDQCDPSSTSYIVLSGEVDLNCSLDE